MGPSTQWCQSTCREDPGRFGSQDQRAPRRSLSGTDDFIVERAKNACIVASGLRWEKHPVRGWSHGPREQKQPDADSKPSSDLGPCSASPLADESVGRVLHSSDCVLRSRSSCRPCPVRLRSRSRRVPTIAGHPMRKRKRKRKSSQIHHFGFKPALV